MRRRTTMGRGGDRHVRRTVGQQPSVVRRRLRAGLTLAGVLLVAAGTQVIPAIPLPQVAVDTVATNLPGVPFETRIQTNRDRLAAAAADSNPKRAAVYQAILDDDRHLLQFNPEANRGLGAWVELVGTISYRTRAVGVIVPGSSAYIIDDNFDKYYERALGFVEQSNETLAMVVWAGGAFPMGWLQGAMARYHAPLGKALATFSHELRMELDRELGPLVKVPIVLVGHSFGGAVVGSAERYGLAADSVLHVASAGMGKVRDPYDYVVPTRPRYSMTAPGDLIGFVQGLPSPPGLGHGPDPDDFRCVVTLPTGRLPTDPAALDELGDALGDRAGAVIGGVSSHSEIFIPGSDAWWEIYRVLAGTAPPAPGCPPPSEPEPLQTRILPLAVPRVVTDSQCRAGGGLRPPWPGGERRRRRPARVTGQPGQR